MTYTNEDLLALAKVICAAMNGPSEYGWDDQSDLYRDRCMDAARCVLVTVRRSRTRIGGDASVAVCPICDIAGCYHIRAAALDVSETPESERQTDLLSESERQAIRDKALDDAAQCCADEADRCDDAVKWGGHRSYVQDCKAAAYAMRDRANAIRKMKGTKG